MKKNEVYVTTNLDDKHLWHNEIKLTDVHWINGVPDLSKTYGIRTRYRAPLVQANMVKDKKGLIVKLNDQVRAVTAGQSAVIYDDQQVLGGGIITV